MNEKKGSATLIMVVLGLVAVGLGIALVIRNHTATVQKEKDDATIIIHSNHWVEATEKLQEQKQVSLNFETQLNAARAEVTNLTASLAEASTNLAEAQMALKYSKEEIAKRDARI